MTRPNNGLILAVPGYGSVNFRWVQEWLKFQSQLAQRSTRYAGLVTTEVPYVDAAMNQIVAECLKRPQVDYIVCLEHDNIPPEGWIDRLLELDPETEKIVGCLYFGKAAEDQRPIPGRINPHTGEYERLSYSEVVAMTTPKGEVYDGIEGTGPGMYKVDVVGCGLTAYHRSVFENWNPPKEYNLGVTRPGQKREDWFQRGVLRHGFLGHDVGFCMAAAAQGHTIWCDTTMVAEYGENGVGGHIGTWVSGLVSYRLSTKHQMEVNAERAAKAEAEAKKPHELTILEGVA